MGVAPLPDESMSALYVLTVLAVASGGVVACLVLYSLFRAASDRGTPTPSVEDPEEAWKPPPATDEACVLRRLHLIREAGCDHVCPVTHCQGKNPLIRRICAWLGPGRGG